MTRVARSIGPCVKPPATGLPSVVVHLPRSGRLKTNDSLVVSKLKQRPLPDRVDQRVARGDEHAFALLQTQLTRHSLARQSKSHLELVSAAVPSRKAYHLDCTHGGDHEPNPLEAVRGARPEPPPNIQDLFEEFEV